MNQIDYKAEVLKVEPSAHSTIEILHFDIIKYSIYRNSTGFGLDLPISNPCKTEKGAWRSAYNSLKQQGRIK